MNLGSRLARQNNTNRKDWMHKLHQCPLQGWDGQWRLAWWGSALPLPIMVIPCPIMARLCSVFQECWAPLETSDSQWTDIYRHTFFFIFCNGARTSCPQLTLVQIVLYLAATVVLLVVFAVPMPMQMDTSTVTPEASWYIPVLTHVLGMMAGLHGYLHWN